MKSNEVLSMLGISRVTLCRYVKLGKIRVVELPNGYYSYNKEDVYKLKGLDVKRKKVIYARDRGLFRSSTGILINADLNGALGIMRKVFPKKALALAKLIGDSGVAFTPVIVNPISCHVVSMKATNNLISFCTTKKVS